MPLPLQKNPGPLLTSKRYGSAQFFPEEFLASIGLVTLAQQDPVDVEPTQIGVVDLLIESSVEQTRTDERRRVDVYLTEVPDTSLESEVMLPTGLIASRSRNLVVDPTDLVVSVLTESADQRNLGNGYLDQVVVTAPTLFHEQLFARERQLLGTIPPEFRSGISQLITSEVVEGIAVDPGPLTGLEEYVSEQQLTVFKKKVEQRGLDVSTVVGELTNYRMTPEQQLETLGIQLTNVEPSPSSFTATTVESEIKALGEGLWLVSEGTVPNVFGKETFTRERSILGAIPPEFRVGINTITTSHEEAGTAVDPGALTGTVEFATQEQVTEFKRKVEQRELDFSVLGTLTNYRMTRDKQLESLTVEVTNVAPTPGSFSATIVESEIKALGGGLWLVTEGTVPNVFSSKTSAKEVPDLVPEIFRALLPTFTTEVTTVGLIVDPPVLSPGDFSKSETQVDEFTKRVTTKGRAGITLPQTTTILRHTIEEYGGEITKVIGFLDASAPSVETGLGIVSSEVRDLGNGTWFRQTEKFDTATAWPVLSSRLWDPDWRTEYDQTEQVVAAGTTEDPNPGTVFGWVSEVRAIDQWRSKKINVSKPTPAYVDEASALVSYAYKPYRFPGLLYLAVGYYVRSADATLVQHKIKTWWVKSSSTPTVVVDEIILDDVVINNLGGTGLTYSGPVLHDALTVGVLIYPATTPSYTQYALGTPTGSVLINNVSLYTIGIGGGYTVGDTITISSGGHSVSADVTAVFDIGAVTDAIASLSTNSGGNFPVGTYGPLSGTGGSGSGALFNVWSFAQTTYTPGTAWIGTYRIIGASVTPEKEKDVWKVQTESVVMR